ncbi:MAG TPA: nitroreductase family protein [Phenylobacterium sp.]|jgi:3-hydroxypropanoate dehydrogenase|nr:nitroreductase family protein [Phenylobacterium sp.]
MGSIVHLTPHQERPGDPALARVLYPAHRELRFAPTPVSRDALEQLHALMSVGPSMVDASPTQVLFLTSGRAKDRLAPHLGPAFHGEVLAAPAIAVVGYDVDFAEQLVEFLPHVAGAPSCFDRPEVVRQTAVRNGGLQGAYLILAARTLGLEGVEICDVDAAGVSLEFFRGARIRAIFLCALGYPAVGD